MKTMLKFLKRNIYYVLLILCIAAIATIVAVSLTTLNRNDVVDVVVPPIDEGEEKPDTDPDPVIPEAMIFDAPVRTGEIGMDYSETQFVFHETLQQYRTHRGIDFKAEAGTEVYAAYEGTVSDISTDLLNGTVIVIDHGDGIQTVYKSLAAEVNVEIGDRVRKRDVIGSVSDSMGVELAEGAHLHFEVLADGELTDPYEYLLEGEK